MIIDANDWSENIKLTYTMYAIETFERLILHVEMSRLSEGTKATAKTKRKERNGLPFRQLVRNSVSHRDERKNFHKVQWRVSHPSRPRLRAGEMNRHG